jgi:hypothetical protein
MIRRILPQGFQSPYLKPGRLGDVLAAIQLMAVSRRYSRPVENWTSLLSGNALNVANPATEVERWRSIFQEHPEFFRQSRAQPGVFALGLRRGLPRRFDPNTNSVLTEAAFQQLPPAEQDELLRPPLSLDDMKTLTDIALSLHHAAADREKESRWWAPVAASIVVGILAIAGTI